MKKKYYILAFTFLCLLIGQNSFAQTTGGDHDDNSGLGDAGNYDGSGETWKDENGRLWGEDSKGHVYADLNRDGILARDEVISYDDSGSTGTGSSEGDTNNDSDGSFSGWGGGVSTGGSGGDCWSCNTEDDSSNNDEVINPDGSGGSGSSGGSGNSGGSGGSEDTGDIGGTAGTGGNTSNNTGGGPNLVVAMPKTQQEYDDLIEASKTFYNIKVKEGLLFTTPDGIQHIGAITKIEGNMGMPSFYFTPTAPDSRFKTGYYYRIPDPKENYTTALSVARDYKTPAHYTYDLYHFPNGGYGYIIDNAGKVVDITISPSNGPVKYITYHVVPSSPTIIGPEFTNSLAINTLSVTVRYKSESNNDVVASLARHIYDMSVLDATKLVNYYNVNVNSSDPANAVTVKAEVSNFYSSNGILSQTTQEFIDWLASVTAIQMDAVSDAYKLEGSDSFDSMFEEDDDFAEAAQTDPFFANNPDDPWRLKQYLSPDDIYLIGVLAGLGDGFIETADLAYTLTKYGIKNTPAVLLYNLVTDTKNTIKDQLDKIQVVKGLITLIYDKPKQQQIVNSIQSLVGNWFEEITFQKTNVQAGYQHGKIFFEILGALIGVEEIKLLLKTGEFSTNALRVVNKLDGAFNSGRKFSNIDGVPHLIDEIGNPIAHGDDITRVVDNLADPINDVQRSLADEYSSIVDDYEETIGDFSNKIKGNYGEIVTDVKLSEKGYIPLHDRIDDINASGHNGIDGVFEKDGQYFIVESKFSKNNTPSLNPANNTTLLPKQMSKDWIERGTELGDAIGDHNLANDIIDAGYTSILATHGPNGNVVYKLVDSAGNIGSVWTP